MTGSETREVSPRSLKTHSLLTHPHRVASLDDVAQQWSCWLQWANRFSVEVNVEKP